VKPNKAQLTGATVALTTMLVAAGLWAQATLGANLLPHAFCITGSQPLLMLHVVSDSLITLAYLLIPLALLNVIRKRSDVPFGWIAWLFSAFIVACGLTHAIDVWTLWDPVYWYAGVMKAFTAAVSLATAWTLYQLTPRFLALPSAQQLVTANAALEREVAIRKQAEHDLMQAKQAVEALLQRTTDQAQRELEEALVQAREANRSKDEFLAKVSHELRSPLQIAMSSSEVLKRLPDMPARATPVVERLAHAIRAQAKMINDLLDVSRILSGKLHMDHELLDPAGPIHRGWEHWAGSAQTAGVSLVLRDLAPAGVMVNADPVRLEQVYTNLIDNAIRFSTNGSQVTVSLEATDTTWQLSVADTGAGIAADDLQRVFQQFTQGETQPVVGKGLGLGLAIVKSVVEAFGGHAWAQSAGLGQGSTFFVELPAHAGDPQPAAAALAHAPPRLDGVRVLYVEDDADVATAMQQGLIAMGAQVDIATGYAQALSQLERQTIDVLVTDLNLGGAHTGYDVALALRAMPVHAAAAMIAVSAFGGSSDLEATSQAGFTAHLVKPIDAASLGRVIEAAVGTLIRPSSWV
jgi:signal transduction histidine kinase/ActR/RegA family two-component response regulator